MGRRVEVERVPLGSETAAELDWRRGRVDGVVVRRRGGHSERDWETWSEERGGGGTGEGAKVREEDSSNFVFDFRTVKRNERRPVSF